MTASLPDGSTANEAEAADRLDTAIDALLAGRPEPRATDDDALEGTARMLGTRLPRLHPRFGFEERLAQRLRTEAAGGHGTVVDFPAVERGIELASALGRAWRPSRWSVVGAVASGISVAVTLAGAVFVVLWRRARGSDASEVIA